MFVVTVIFRVKPAHAEAFLTAIRENSRASLANETGCSRFDVATGEDGAVFLYELYDDRAAFDAHLASAHFKSFDRESAPWVEEKIARTWQLV